MISGHALEPVALAQAVLEEVGPVAGDQPAVVDLDREPRRARADLRRVVERAGACRGAAAAGAGRRRRRRSGSAPASGSARRGGRRAPTARSSSFATPRPVSAEQAITGGRWRTRLRDPRLRCPPDQSLPRRVRVFAQVPLVERDQGRAAGLHRQLGDPQVLGGHALGGVADNERDVGALGGALGAQLGVVVDRARDLAAPPDARPCRPAARRGRRPRAGCRSRRASFPPARRRSPARRPGRR